MLDVIVIGAGPAGVVAVLRAADLGAKTGGWDMLEFDDIQYILLTRAPAITGRLAPAQTGCRATARPL